MGVTERKQGLTKKTGMDMKRLRKGGRSACHIVSIVELSHV